MGILNSLTASSEAAYSLRKLLTAYTGSAIRVRRSSDNTESDIGFDGSGNLDTSALLTFVGVVPPPGHGDEVPPAVGGHG